MVSHAGLNVFFRQNLFEHDWSCSKAAIAKDGWNASLPASSELTSYCKPSHLFKALKLRPGIAGERRGCNEKSGWTMALRPFHQRIMGFLTLGEWNPKSMNYYNPTQSQWAGSELWTVKAFVWCLSYHGRWNSHSATVAEPKLRYRRPCIFYLQIMFCLFICYHRCINGKKGISFLSFFPSLVFWER